MTDKELEKIFKSKQKKVTVSKKGKISISAGFSKAVTFEHFKAWFNQEEFDKGCHYCNTTNEQSLELYNLRPHATRGGKRGKRLELDRRDPVKDYDELDNIVWCCYWCNNAKSNFFSEEEFIPIAEAIGEVLNKIK